MAASDMGAYSQSKTNPSRKSSTKRRQFPSPEVLKPVISELKEKSDEVCATCVNQIACSAEECDLRRWRHSIPVNIAESANPRRGRRAKAPKPLPYLVPISTKRDRPVVVVQSAASTRQRRKRITFATSEVLGLRRRRARSERLTSRKEQVLAYLVVDLQSGTLANSSDDLCVSRARSFTAASINLSPSRPSTVERAMSMSASSKPMPLPRRKPAEKEVSPAAPLPRQRTESAGRDSTPPPPPVAPRKRTSEREQVRSPSQQATGNHHTSVVRGSSSVPLSGSTETVTPPAVALRRHLTNPEIDQKLSLSSSVSSPPRGQDVFDGSPPPAGKPPPLPAKSEFTRKLQQHSIKKSPLTASKEESPEAYEVPTEKVQSPSFYTLNDSYGVQETEEDRPSAEYEVPDPVDVPEEMYIDPTKSKQFSSSGKPKPPRPPPPSSSAIRKAQQRKANSLASNKPKSTSTKPSSKWHTSTPNIHSTARHDKGKVQSGIKMVIDQQAMVYEELDAGDSSPIHSTLWRPPSQQITTKEPVPAERNAPALPPRTCGLAPSKHRRTKRGTTSSPVTRSSTLTKGERYISNKSESEENEPDNDNDCVYELVDVTIPLAPSRKKKNVKVTRAQTTTETDKRYTIHSHCAGKPPLPSRGTANFKSKSLPRNSLALATQRMNRTAEDSSSPKKQLRDTREGKSLAEKVSEMKVDDEAGAEEYVEMRSKNGWLEEKDGPDVYVDMEPGVAEEEEEDGPFMGPYASSNLLSSRPDLKT